MDIIQKYIMKYKIYKYLFYYMLLRYITEVIYFILPH